MANDILLRDVIESDILIFFEHQLDPAANHMVAFAAKDPTDRDAFTERWTRILGNDAIVKKAILFGGDVVGHLVSFERFGKPEIGYWLGREYWGKGIATSALSELLRDIPTRPLYARVSKDNLASLRVLEKCGFTISGAEKAFSEVRGEEVEEFILELSGSGEDEA
jgi:RimJ/RimL family protein N-acetyltransferase